MTLRMLIPTASLAVALGALLCAGAGPAAAAGLKAEPRAPAAAPVVTVVASDSGSQFVPLGIGKSVVVDLPRDVKDVLVADPKIANAVIRSSRRAYLIGVDIGQT